MKRSAGKKSMFDRRIHFTLVAFSNFLSALRKPVRLRIR